MGRSPGRERGAHARPRSAVPLVLPTTRARHARPTGVSRSLLAVTAGGLALVAVLPAVVSATAGSNAPAAAGDTVQARPSASAAAGGRLLAAAVARPVQVPAAGRLAAGLPPAVRPAAADAPARVAVSPRPAVAATAAPLLPGCTGSGDVAGHANGRLPDDVLCDLDDGSGERLRADAARAFAALAQSYAAVFGHAPCVIDGYRTLGEQQVLRLTKRRFAATPGMSEHGWGLAVDLGCGVQSSHTPTYAWMARHAGRFGWVHPAWAEPGGSRPEPWHWEYVPGT